MTNRGYLKSAMPVASLLTVIVLLTSALISCGAEIATVTTGQQGDASHQAPMATPLNTITTTPTQTQNAVSTASATDTEVAVGQPYIRPYDIKVVRVAEAPLISQEAAITAVYNQHGKAQWTLGNNTVSSNQKATAGKLITVSATYGLVTEGYRIKSGAWVGNILNFDVEQCTIDGKCTPTGEIRNHIENTLMWVLDYDGIGGDDHGGRCPFDPQTCAGLTIVSTTHTLILVDAQTLKTINVGFY